MSALPQKMDDLAKEHGLVAMNTEAIIDMAKHDMLVATFRRNPKTAFDKDMNARVTKVYKDWYNADFKQDVGRARPLYLYGPPGQGKTTSLKVAAKEVAAALGLNYLENPNDSDLTTLLPADFKARAILTGDFDDPADFDDKESKNAAEKELRTGYRAYLKNKDKEYKETFLFVSLEMSGENSSTTFGGIPCKVEEVTPDGKSVTYMKKLPNKRLALLEHVAGGYLLLDDFANAAPNVQNTALSVTDEGRFQGLDIRNVAVGLTGNLGATDGTNTAGTSTALSNRVIPIFTHDTPENFRVRAYERFNDDVGDVGVIGFQNRYPQHFYQIPSGKSKGGFPSSRSWDNYIVTARATVRSHGGHGKGEAKALDTLKLLAGSMLGLAVQQDLSSYYDSLMRNADPIARAVIVEGKLKEKKEEIQRLYGQGHSEPQRSWGYSFCMASVDYLIRSIADAPEGKEREKAFEVHVKRFGESMMQINEHEFTFACNHLKDKLAVAVPEYTIEAGPAAAARATPGSKRGRRALKSEVLERVVKIFAKLEDFDQRHCDALIRALADTDKMDGTSRTRRVTR